MNNTPSNGESSKPSKSIKQSHRVQAQLAQRKKAKNDAVSKTVTTSASLIELMPTSAPPPVERVHLDGAETSEPVEIVPELQLRKVEQADRKMLGKVKRAFVKAGVEAGPEAQAAFLNALLMDNVRPV